MPKQSKAASYTEWVLHRIVPRQGKKGILLCSTAPLLKPPKYLGINAYQAEKELLRLREEGLIVCTNRWWWMRGSVGK